MQGLLYLIGLGGKRSLISCSFKDVSERLRRSIHRLMMFFSTIKEKEKEIRRWRREDP